MGEPLHSKVSVIMPALNSGKTIRMSLESVRKQDYPQELVEILVIDGGSTDKTREIAAEFGCTVLENPKVQQEYAKHSGLTHARGKVAIFLDSDEVLFHTDSIRKRVAIIENHPDVKIVLTGGSRHPAGFFAINDYSITYSDPFSYFIYGVSSDYRFYLKNMLSKPYIHKKEEDDSCVILELKKGGILPLVDICSGVAIDLEFFKDEFQEQIADASIVPRVFYLIINHKKNSAVLKDDWIFHYSADSIRKYIGKIQWRVIANIHYQRIPGTGFSNREEFEPALFRYKKYLFIPYALTLVLPLLNSIYLAAAKRSAVLLLHAPLCFITAVMILYYYFLRWIGVKPGLKSYGKGDKKLNL